jgi:tRNA/tmRNA/rRNA uracil-C5-methylase (TrmA/RlmC/RlmD family)
MKKFVIATAITFIATSAFASDFVVESIQESTVQTVAVIVADFTEATSLELSDVTSNAHRKLEAQRIQNDVQVYSQSGILSVYLAEKVKMVNALDADLSQEEAVDVLVLASNKILKL